MPPLLITEKDLPALKLAYKKARESNKDFFIYKQGELVTDYAKYLIEYLEMKTKNKND